MTEINRTRRNARSADGVDYTFDRNGALVVDPYSVLRNPSFRQQIQAAMKLGRLHRMQRRTAKGG